MEDHGKHAFKTRNSPRPISYGALSISIFASLAALVVGVFIILGNVREPFALKGGVSSSNGLPSLDTQEASKEALKASDTDGDTLSDYDELYVYHTSPYLKDTDSDTFDDKQEIATGHDPNCPDGQNCFGLPISSTSTPSVISPGKGVGTDPFGSIFGGSSPASLEDLGSLSVDQIKKLLISQGIKEEDLAKVDDNTLRALYQKTYRDFVTRYESTGQIPAPSAPAPSAIDESKLAHPESLTPDEIRDLIRRAGSIPEDQLKSIDDKTLKDLFIQSVNKAKEQQK